MVVVATCAHLYIPAQAKAKWVDPIRFQVALWQHDWSQAARVTGQNKHMLWPYTVSIPKGNSQTIIVEGLLRFYWNNSSCTDATCKPDLMTKSVAVIFGGCTAHIVLYEKHLGLDLSRRVLVVLQILLGQGLKPWSLGQAKICRNIWGWRIIKVKPLPKSIYFMWKLLSFFESQFPVDVSFSGMNKNDRLPNLKYIYIFLVVALNKF